MGTLTINNTYCGPITTIKYGALYNWYAATDARNISSSDDWVVPTQAQYTTLQTYLGGLTVAGGKLKETGTTYWDSPNTGATNETGFNARGSGYRDADGVYVANLLQAAFVSTYTAGLPTTHYWAMSIVSNSSSMAVNSTSPKKGGNTIRLLYTGAGIPTYYAGNDGKKYRVVTIGTQTWLADNIYETKYRNGDWITGFDGGTYTPISNANWAAKTTEAMCLYNDDTNNG